MMKRFRIILLFVPFLLFSCTETRTVWLDELDLTLADQATGVTRANQSMWRTPLVVAADTFKRGVGTHAFGVMRVALDGRTRSFEARVGVDGSAPADELAQASVEFVVIGDGDVLWRSGVMRGGDEARHVKVPLRGVKSLILRTDHAGDGLTGDRADWVEARFEVAGDDPCMVRRTQEEAYILTPDEPASPQINPPYRYGVRPGNPVLFTIPVSGERPMTVRVDNLPAGLKVDATTGILTGRVSRPGTYALYVTAENAHGTATGTLTLEVGDTLALTPPMGWSSWNVFGEDIDDAKIRAMADALVEHGLNRYGYAYINIDDGWQGVRGGKYNAIMPNEKFPDMKALVDYVHSKGLKIGIYSSPWVETFAGFIGGSADTPDGRVINSSRRMGEYSFIENDVRQWAEWGFDYLKYDWTTNDVLHATAMLDALRASGRDIVYSMANNAPFNLAADWQRLTNARRTTGDIIDTWCSMTTIGFTQDKWQPYARPGSWNDPGRAIYARVVVELAGCSAYPGMRPGTVGRFHPVAIEKQGSHCREPGRGRCSGTSGVPGCRPTGGSVGTPVARWLVGRGAVQSWRGRADYSRGLGRAGLGWRPAGARLVAAAGPRRVCRAVLGIRAFAWRGAGENFQ